MTGGGAALCVKNFKRSAGWRAFRQTFETLQVVPPGGTKIDFPARIAQTCSARNHPRRIANGTQMSDSLQ